MGWGGGRGVLHSLTASQARKSDGNGIDTDLRVWGRNAAAQAWAWQASKEEDDVSGLVAAGISLCVGVGWMWVGYSVE